MKLEEGVFTAIEAANDAVFNSPPRPESEVTEERDLVYDGGEPDVCRLDTFRPRDKDGPLPAIMYIHGGGFVAGDKRHRRGVSCWYAGQGAFVFNVNYGLCPRFGYPQPLVHLVRAVNYIAGRASELGIDMNRFIVTGDSAGGYYAAMLAVAGYDDYVSGKIGESLAARPSGAVFNCGLFDAASAIERKLPLDLGKRIYRSFSGGESTLADFEYGDIASPLERVTSSFPPSLVIYSRKDVFCSGQAERLIAALTVASVPVEQYCARRLVDNHCFPLAWKTPAARAANAKTEAFVKKILSL